MNSTPHLRHIDLRFGAKIKHQPEIEQDITAALTALRQEHLCLPLHPTEPPPYDLSLSLHDRRLVMEFSTVTRQAESGFVIGTSLQALRPLIKDYFLICESYLAAAHSANRTRLEVIDAGRRATHDEAATVLRETLADKIMLDFATARRFFTLIAALHLGSWSRRAGGDA
jgi:uncharacterized protein (UPF0262 family)